MVAMTIKEAIRKALVEEMERDPFVFLIGEDIGVYGGAFGVTAGFLERFGKERVIDTPICEATLAGIATGTALMGLRPVLEVMFMDFSTLIVDQVLNHMTKFKYMFGGSDDIRLPLVIRTPYGGGRAYGASHSQSLEAIFMHIPGLKIVAPSNPYSACSLLKASIRDDNPVMFLENKLLYSETGEVPEKVEPGDIGRSLVIRSGDDITFISYGRMLLFCIEAARQMEKKGITVEVIDLCTLAPLDRKTLAKSVEKTGRIIVVEEGTLTAGVGAEICSSLMETSFFYLEAPPCRVAGMDLPIPYSPELEVAVLPDVRKIIETAMKILEY